MSGRMLLGVFQDEDGILGASRAARERGLRIVEAYTPYAVHGLDKAIGLKRSRLPLVCLVAGALGAVLKLWFEIWTAAIDWPIDVGGKPWNSLPAFVPITFEVMVLFAGLATVAAFILVSGLRPGRQAKLMHPRVTNDRFALLIEETDAAFDVEEVRRLLIRCGAVEVSEQISDEVYA
jgi:hypothetical protein